MIRGKGRADCSCADEGSEHYETVVARVFSGRGVSSTMRARDVAHIASTYSIPLRNGSLNLAATSPLWLDTRQAIYVSEDQHYFWPARLNGFDVILNRWASTCPVHIFEIFSVEHLRSKFGLADGDSVMLEVSRTLLDQVSSCSWRSALIWYLVWRGRERHVYRDGLYRKAALSRTIHTTTWRAYQQAC